MNTDEFNLGGTGTAVEFDGVSRHFGATKAVDDLSLSIEPGEFFVLVGPSGCGKTTLLMLLAGFEQPDSGAVRIGGRDVSSVPPAGRDIGVVFQTYALFPHMTVGDNVGFPLRMRGLRRAERRRHVEEALDLVQLRHKANVYPSTLSGGQQQRVALARALVFGPTLLLLDEPLAALDRALREEMQYELRRLHRELGITVLAVTHDQREAMAMADRIGVMRDGQLAQIDSPSELYRKPSSHFVAKFVGDASILEATVAGDGLAYEVFGVSFDAPGEGELTPGPCQVAIPPECVLIEDPDSGSGIPGEIEDVTFLGPTLRIVVQLDGGSVLEATCLAPVGAHLKAGQRVVASWSPADVVVLGSKPPQDPRDNT